MTIVIEKSWKWRGMTCRFKFVPWYFVFGYAYHGETAGHMLVVPCFVLYFIPKCKHQTKGIVLGMNLLTHKLERREMCANCGHVSSIEVVGDTVNHEYASEFVDVQDTDDEQPTKH